MISRIKNIYANFQSRKGIINNDSVSVSSAPGIIEEPIYDEIYDPTPPSEFEQVDNQCHFGILRYIVSYRFRTLMLIALVSLVVVLFIFVFFLIAHLEKKHEDVPVSSTLHNYLKTTTVSAPTTSATTTNPYDRTDCSPHQNSTFFFAYSNYFTADQVVNTWKSFSVNSNLFFETYALGRFDMVDNLNQSIVTFVSSNSFNVTNSLLLNNLPNSTESIKDPSEGSRVLDIIDVFFDSDVAHCGTTLFILTKLYPRDTSIDELVFKLQKYHAYVTFIVSENSFGGLRSQPRYRLASETNGLCIFTEDDKIQEIPFWLPSIWPLYLVYSFNAKVANSGTVDLPVFNVPLAGYYHICMTLQDHDGLGNFRMVHLEWYNSESSNSGFLEETLESHAAIYGKTTYIRKGPYRLDALPYNMTLGFEYSDEEIHILQIRIYSTSAVNFWVPYNN